MQVPFSGGAYVCVSARTFARNPPYLASPRLSLAATATQWAFGVAGRFAFLFLFAFAFTWSCRVVRAETFSSKPRRKPQHVAAGQVAVQL